MTIGYENVTDLFGKNTSNFIIGINSVQSIMFIPTTKSGIYVSAGFYETYFTSEIYKYDVGVKVEVGIKLN